MSRVLRIYDGVIVGLAIIAGAMVAAVFLMIVYDVAVRTLGFQPPFWTSALTEYALLYMTMLAAPWLVRQKGHVFVESLTLMLKARAQHAVHILAYLISIVLCLALAFYSVKQGLEVWSRQEIDIRSISIPGWLLYASLPFGFCLSAIEFARFLLGCESMYSGRDVGGL